MKSVLFALCAALAPVSCAHQVPAADISTPSIRGAEEAGAEESPTAALHLLLAKESEADAKEMEEDGDDDEAASMRSRSVADAELAVILARVEAARLDAIAAELRLHTLKTNP
jgi:hypothetical protein